jgi:HlyD family secretion protein
MKYQLIYKWAVKGALLASLAFFTACNNTDSAADAFGNFEAEEVIVSAQTQGVILSFNADEGDSLVMNKMVGIIDTSTASIKLSQLIAQRKVINARLMNIAAQLKVQEEQRANLQREVDRTRELLADNAATSQQYDDLKGKLNVLDSQTEAIKTQTGIINSENAVLSAQIAESYNMIDKCKIISPIDGTLLEKYVEGGELVAPGKSLFKIADISELILRVYISESQLSDISLNDSVTVLTDKPDGGLEKINGLISWISSEVEFTPKIIQTREERVNMVYAVKIRVKNNGHLKIGMPGEVIFLKHKKI